MWIYEIYSTSVQAGVPEDMERVNELLQAGWEPYAVTSWHPKGDRYHLRRKYLKG